jgi:hypothetical protein
VEKTVVILLFVWRQVVIFANETAILHRKSRKKELSDVAKEGE